MLMQSWVFGAGIPIFVYAFLERIYVRAQAQTHVSAYISHRETVQRDKVQRETA